MQDSGEIFKLVHQGLLNAGYDADDIIRRIKRPIRPPSSEDRFNHELQIDFWDVLEDYTGDPEIGLHLCPHLPVYHGPVFEYIVLSATNYGEGIQRACRFQRLVSDAFRMRLENDEEGARVYLTGTSGEARQLRHSEVCFAYSWIKAMATVTTNDFRPERVNLCLQPATDEAEYEALFGCQVDFTGRESEVWMQPEFLERSSPHRNTALRNMLEQYAKDQLDNLRRQDLTSEITSYLQSVFLAKRGVDADSLRLEHIARRFGMSPRHMRFILSEAGQSFRDLLREARFSVARKLLASTDEHVDRIGEILGFSETSTFHRAFKSWTGETPQRYRENVRE